MPFNCPDQDNYDRRSLAELRQMMTDGLGFIDQVGGPTRTLGELRQDIMDRLGFVPILNPPNTTTASRTLLQMRTEVLSILGLAQPLVVATATVSSLIDRMKGMLNMGAMGALAPGVEEEFLAFLNTATQMLFRRLELDMGDTPAPALYVNTAQETELVDCELILVFAVALAKAKNGMADAKAYQETAERALADMVQRRPPNIVDMVNKALAHAQRALIRRFEEGLNTETFDFALSGDTDLSMVDAQPVMQLALANLKAKIGQGDAKQYLEQYERYVADQMKRSPPNIATIITKALQSAHQTVIRRLGMGTSGSPGPFTADGHETSIDYQPVFLLALANVMAKFRMDDARGSYNEFEQYIKDRLQRSPPNAASVVNRFLRDTQEKLYRRYDIFRMERYYTWSMPANERYYGIASNDEVVAETPTGLRLAVQSGGTLAAGTYYYAVSAVAEDEASAQGETLACSPVAITTTATGSVLMTWNEVVPAAGYTIVGYRIYRGTSPTSLGLLETVIPGSDSTSYNVDDGSDTPTTAPPTSSSYGRMRRLDPRQVSWCGVSQGDDQWRQLRRGIPPWLYASPQSGVPTHYDVRQCIEVWPAPVDGWMLRIKGEFGLDRFEDDADLTTIDWQAVYLFALADAKAHYRQDDARVAGAAAQTYLGDLVAGSHGDARYFPGSLEPRNAVRPVMVPDP